jgi:hypothetical protein
MENLYEILKNNDAIIDKKELMELFHLRQIKINNKLLTIPEIKDKIEKIQIGHKVINIK